MTVPTISDYFGSNAEVISSAQNVPASTTEPYLVIRLKDFTDVGLQDDESYDDPDKLLAAIVLKTKAFTDTDTTEDSGAEVANPTKSFAIRKNTSVIAIAYDVAFYIADPTTNGIDPDQVI